MIQKLLRSTVLVWLLCFASSVYAQQLSPVEYQISLKDAVHHIVNVSVSAQTQGPEIDFQLPVWNALYQVRDFAKDVISFTAKDPATVQKLDKTTWRVSAYPVKIAPRITISYQIIADQPGPFSAQLNLEHAFFNLAQILVYPVGQKDRPIQLHFTDVPPGWKLATPLIDPDSVSLQPEQMLHARNYDHMVDSPCEFGSFQDFSFEQDGAKYRIIIDGNIKDYKPAELVSALRKITAAETAWMNDRPFHHYLFIYYIPKGPAGGGMEHAYSTAIGISARNLGNLAGFESVSAHEFFHLWNVKRIRPQSLEPIDYSKENYTRALWFSEGVTTTVANLTLLRAGLLDEKGYLERLSSAITVLQNRPAHLTQSAEESSLDTWFDGYPSYRAPERSINYYNKGEILGTLLDLKMRQDSQGKKSLRDLFKSMNQNYARQGKFFADSEGVRTSAEMLTGTDLRDFFHRYIAGVEELPYDDLFATVGLRLSKRIRRVPDLGFSALHNFDGPLLVNEVTGTAATAAGIRTGDEIVQIDGKIPPPDFAALIASKSVGSTVRLNVRRGSRIFSVRLTLEAKETAVYNLDDLPNITAAQRARRAAWLASEDEPQSASPNSRFRSPANAASVD